MLSPLYVCVVHFTLLVPFDTRSVLNLSLVAVVCDSFYADVVVKMPQPSCIAGSNPLMPMVPCFAYRLVQHGQEHSANRQTGFLCFRPLGLRGC